MGVWIETVAKLLFLSIAAVTPYVGVWIETSIEHVRATKNNVTPYVGVWIETITDNNQEIKAKSLLMWECGLKHMCSIVSHGDFEVTPYVGVWIETSLICE